MLKRKYFIGLILVIILSMGLIVNANTGVDDRGNPNDPDVNDRSNACFEDGSMEDKCDTE